MAALVVLTVLAVGGTHRFEGDVLFTVSTSHGLHIGDVPLIVLAGLAVLAVWTT